MGSGRVWGIVAFSIILLSVFSLDALASICDDPHCLKIDEVQKVDPFQAQRPDLMTGAAVTDISSRVIEEIDRGGKPVARRFRMRRYPVDISQQSNVSLGFGDVIEFRLNRTKYLLEVTDLSKGNMQIKILPTKEKTNLTPHETKTYDVNHDGTPDLSLTMGEIEVNQVQVTITPGENVPPQAGPSSPMGEITTMVPSVPAPAIQPLSPGVQQPAPEVQQVSSPSSYQQEAVPQAAPSPQPEVTQPSGVPATVPPPSYMPPPETAAEMQRSYPVPQQSQFDAAPPYTQDQYPPPSISEPAIVAQPSEASSLGIVGWGLAIALSVIALMGITTAFVVRREHQHVDTVTEYLINSLGQKVPLPQAIQALGQAGWSKRLTDKALANLADKYKADSVAKGGDSNMVKGQLASAGVPEDVLNQIFK